MFPLEAVFGRIAEVSWRAGGVLLMFFIIRKLVYGRIPARFLFVAWLVFSWRMLLPFSLSIPWVPPRWAAMSSPTAPSPGGPGGLVDHGFSQPAPLARAGAESAPSIHAVTPAAATTPPFRWTLLAAEVWLAGMVVMVMLRVVARLAFAAKIRKSAQTPDARCLQLLEEGTRTLDIRTPVTMTLSPAIEAPAIYGWLRPHLVFPVNFIEKLSDAEIQQIVFHELGHWSRGDLMAQGFLWAARVVHWFNPLVWIAARWARLDCELACDEFVMGRMSSLERNAYGETLLKVLELVREKTPSEFVLGILENKQQLKQRIQRIISFQSASLGRLLAGGALVGTLTLASVALETKAQETRPTAARNKETPAPLPAAWFKKGKNADRYLAGLDPAQTYAEHPSLFVRSTQGAADEDYVGLMQLCSAEKYVGRRIRFSAWIKTDAVNGEANILVRADGAGGILRFDHLGTRAPQGSADWAYYSASLEVPEGTVNLVYGFALRSTGAAWFSNPLFEEMSDDVNEAERDLEAFRVKYNFGAFQEDRNNLLAKIGTLGKTIVASEVEQINLKTTLAQVDDHLKENKDLLELSAIRTFGNILPLKAQIDDLNVQRAILANKYFDDYPAMRENTLALEGAEKRLKETIALAKADLEARLSISIQFEKKLRAELADAEESARAFDQIDRKYRALEKKVDHSSRPQGIAAGGAPGSFATGVAAIAVPEAEIRSGSKVRKTPELRFFE